MERNDLVDGFGRSRQPRGQQGSQRFGGFENQGLEFEGLFAKMDLNDDVGNMGLSSPTIGTGVLRAGDGFVGSSDNLVSGVYGLGFGNVNSRVDNMMYRNVYLNSVETPFGTVHSYYQPEVERAQMMEFWRRSNVGWDAGGQAVEVDYARRGRGGRAVEEVNLMDLRGQILGLAKSQNGCKMLQMTFGEIKEEEIEMILEEVGDNVSSLMMDQFGNYFVQKLIEVCNEEQRTRIIHSVTKNPYQLISVCLNLHGTRAVQKLLENLTNEQQIAMVISAVSPGVVPMIKDCNAYHVIQYCLKYFSDENNRFLINEIARNCYEIATDKSGCCVLQLCVDITKGEVKQYLISEITANALQLSHDRYGNYVVQHLLLMKVPNITARLLNELQGHFLTLACNKYGSNVVEKCLTETDNEFSELVILELLKTPGVSKLLLDPFGNYVFQSALSVSQGLLHNALVSLVEKHAAFMTSNLYGKKVLAWFDRKRLSLMHKNMRS